MVDGLAGKTVPLNGWTGWDCSQYLCPLGDNYLSRYGGGGQYEQQRVVCSLTSGSFTLDLFGDSRQTSLPIYPTYTAAQVRACVMVCLAN